MMTKPETTEYASFYKNYVNSVAENDAISALENSGKNLLFFLRSLPESKGHYAYAPDKWTVNDLLQHLIDSEIIFTYRALRIARGDKTPLAGFEQDEYVLAAQASYKSLTELISILEQTRAFTISLFKSFNHSDTTNTGVANGAEVSLRALGFIIAGHCQHHLNVLKERYI